MALRRIQKELRDAESDPYDGVRLFAVSSDLFELRGVIQGPEVLAVAVRMAALTPDAQF